MNESIGHQYIIEFIALSAYKINMGFSTACRYWFILQVVVIVVCYRGKESSTSKTVQSCVGSQLELRCSSTKVIRIKSIKQGISSCNGATCCSKDAGCDQKLSEEHKKSVHKRCDDQQNCTVDISFEKKPCTSSGWWWGWGKKTTDGHAYEKITYECGDGPGTNVTSTAEILVELLGNNTKADGKDDDREKADELNSQVPPVVMVIIGVVLLITIVVLVVVMYRRRKLPQPNLLHPVEMRAFDSNKDETAIYANETQVTSPHENNDFLCTTVCKADLPKTEADPTVYTDVEILKIDRNQTAKTNSGHNAINPDQNTGPDVYALVNKPSNHAATSSAFKTGVSEKQGWKGPTNTGDSFPDQTNESEGAADIYCNESFAVSSTRSETGTVSKPPSPQDDGGLIVIENDLYCH